MSHPDVDRASIAEAKGQRAPGTCEWIRENSHYQTWLEKKSPLFWISGGPGTGKTVMSLFLSEQVEKVCQGTGDHFIFYFCRFQHECYNKPGNLLRSLAYQMLSFGTDTSAALEIFSYLDTEEKTNNALSNLECLWKILEILLSQADLSTVYCIIDGVDECQSSDVLICKFRDYCTSAVGSKGSLRLALIGRDLDILGMAAHSRRHSLPSQSSPESIFAETSAMNVFTGIKLDPDHGENLDSDIARFTRWSLEPLQRIHGFESIRSQIEQTLLARAEGTFLWVSFVVHELSKKRTCLQVLETIQDIPPGLHPIFGRMLHQIDPKHRDMSARILKWIAITIRPLTLRELAYAVGSGIECMADRITICQPLLKVYDDRVLFVHQSAREYLLRDQIDEDPTAELFRVEASKCHGEVAYRCLQILENSILQHATLYFSLSDLNEMERGHVTQRDQLPAALWGRPELFNYAYFHWMKHTRLSAQDAQNLFDFSRPFFKKSSRIRRNWARSNGNIAQGRLHMASFYGIMPWLQALREEGSSITFHGTRRWKKWVNSTRKFCTPLEYAIEGDCQEAARFLLDHGADTEGESSALWKATSLGRDKMVQILLENGAQITNKSYDRSVLITAARKGPINVVQLLLNHGADINIRNDQNQTALIIAALFAHERLVLFLLGHGAHLDVADFRVWLHQMAVKRGSRWSTRVVHTILRHVPDICWAGEDGGRLLNLAAEWTDHEIVQLCLKKGVNINWKHPNGGTALVESILKDQRRSPPGVYGTHLRLPHDDRGIIKIQPGMIANIRAILVFLLDHGADLNLSSEFRDGSLRPPLVIAARQGFDWAIEELMKYGADCNTRAMVHRKPEPRKHRLASAFRRSHTQQEPEDLIQGGTALIYAVRSKQVSTVRLLLAYGADTSLVDENKRTAFEWACRMSGFGEYHEIKQVLREHDSAMGCSA